MTEPKRLHVITWGCQMNVYDSGRMADVLATVGYRPVDEPDGADMVILNTCHIRDKAAEKVFSELGRLRRLKEATGNRMILAVAGCVAQAEGQEILARAPYVDIVLGPQTYHRLPDMVAKASQARAVTAERRSADQSSAAYSARTAQAPVIEIDFPPEDKFDHLPESTVPQGVTAFLTIQEGCDKFCSFCVVPYTRGAEQSRPTDAIMREARHLVAQGAREITLLGQNVNAWHGAAPGGNGSPATWGLGRLLRELADVPGLLRLRYATSHPRDMDDELIQAHRDIPTLMPFLHLPIQSGSDRILGVMNRKHTADDYRRIIARLRNARPDLALSSDFIVGHPGETEADFEATMQLVRDVSFAQAFSFKYSPRPGTPAASIAEQVPAADKDRRLQALQGLLRDQQTRFAANCVGLELPVLFTGAGRHPGQIVGRSPFLQPVHVSGSASLIGCELMVRIVAAHPNSLAGTLLQERRTA